MKQRIIDGENEVVGKAVCEPPVCGELMLQLIAFEQSRLPDSFKEMSERFWALAICLNEKLPDNDARSVSLARLLEAQDWAVRACVLDGRVL